MKSLKEYISYNENSLSLDKYIAESLQINKENDTRKIKKLTKLGLSCSKVNIKEKGEGWAFGYNWYCWPSPDNDVFDKQIRILFKVFGQVDVWGKIYKSTGYKSIDLEEAMQVYENNFNDKPKGSFYFVLEPDSKIPTICSEQLLSKVE